MPRIQKKYHYIYKTTCLKNGKWYIGMRSSNSNPNEDDYLGSGKVLGYFIGKYGRENFEKEIIEVVSDRETLVKREEEIVNEDVLKDPNCVNLRVGGQGGFSREVQRENAKKSNKRQKWLMENDPEWKANYSKNMSKGLKEAYKKGTRKPTPYDWTGRKHTEETKKKMSESSKGCRTGQSNSQYGTMWITNEKENKKILKSELIPNGWRKGRKMVDRI